jgi:hypothetical protein
MSTYDEEYSAQRHRDQQATRALGGSRGNVLSGTREEQEGQLAGLNLGNIGYGQGLSQTGEDIQRLRDLQRARTDGTDPVSQAIRNQKGAEVARAQRESAASGVKAGAAMGAANDIARKKDSDIASSLYGQKGRNIASERSFTGNMLSGQISTMQGEKAGGSQLPGMPASGGGGFFEATSFICTMLRSKGLMTSKESFIMTKFMLRSMFSRADFLVWYFKHGKAAVDKAEKENFDWASVKYVFVDNIIDLINKGKIVEAQNEYIQATGLLCSMYEAKGFKAKLTTPSSFAVLHFPRLFLNKVCRSWLSANYKNVFKLLRS